MATFVLWHYFIQWAIYTETSAAFCMQCTNSQAIHLNNIFHSFVMNKYFCSNVLTSYKCHNFGLEEKILKLCSKWFGSMLWINIKTDIHFPLKLLIMKCMEICHTREHAKLVIKTVTLGLPEREGEISSQASGLKPWGTNVPFWSAWFCTFHCNRNFDKAMYLRSHTVAQPIQNYLWNFCCNIQLLSHIFDPS